MRVHSTSSLFVCVQVVIVLACPWHLMVQASERRGPELPAAQGADRHWGGSPEWADQPARQAGNPSSSICSEFSVDCRAQQTSLGEGFVWCWFHFHGAADGPLEDAQEECTSSKLENHVLCSNFVYLGVPFFLPFPFLFKEVVEYFLSENIFLQLLLKKRVKAVFQPPTTIAITFSLLKLWKCSFSIF